MWHIFDLASHGSLCWRRSTEYEWCIIDHMSSLFAEEAIPNMSDVSLITCHHFLLKKRYQIWVTYHWSHAITLCWRRDTEYEWRIIAHGSSLFADEAIPDMSNVSLITCYHSLLKKRCRISVTYHHIPSLFAEDAIRNMSDVALIMPAMTLFVQQMVPNISDVSLITCHHSLPKKRYRIDHTSDGYLCLA